MLLWSDFKVDYFRITFGVTLGLITLGSVRDHVEVINYFGATLGLLWVAFGVL